MHSKIQKFAYIGIAVFTSAVFIYVMIAYLLPAVLPFILSYAVVRITRSPSDVIAKKLRLKK